MPEANMSFTCSKKKTQAKYHLLVQDGALEEESLLATSRRELTKRAQCGYIVSTLISRKIQY